MMSADLSDADLLAAVAARDVDALSLLYERHAQLMLRVLARICRTRAVAEEVLQESWLAVWQSAASYRGQSSVRGWLLGVARRQAHNQLRRNQVQEVELDDRFDFQSEGPAVENRVLAAAGHDELIEALRNLPEHLREVVLLAFVDELPYADIAALLEIPLGTVKRRIFTARRTLTRTLSDFEVTR